MRALSEPSLLNKCSSKPACLPQAGPLPPQHSHPLHAPNSIPLPQPLDVSVGLARIMVSQNPSSVSKAHM